MLSFIILAISNTDTEVNGKFKTLDVYIKEYGDMKSVEAKAYTSRLITDRGLYVSTLSVFDLLSLPTVIQTKPLRLPFVLSQEAGHGNLIVGSNSFNSVELK